MVYNTDHNIKIINDVQAHQKIIFDESISEVQIFCLLGIINIGQNCNALNNASNLVTFYIKDIYEELIIYEFIELFVFELLVEFEQFNSPKDSLLISLWIFLLKSIFIGFFSFSSLVETNRSF